MAVDNPVLFNDYWVYLRFSMGSTHLNPNDKQKHNATKIYDALRSQGYTPQAAAGILGNMQTESGLSPGALDQHLSSLPNNGEHLSELTNDVMINYCDNNGSGYGTGLIQWDGYTSTAPAGNVIVSFAMRYGYEWYDGECQLFRLQREYETDSTYHFWSKNNVSPAMTWQQFKQFTGSPERAADIFRLCRERGGTAVQNRRDNAAYWFQYFQEEPPIIADWIDGEDWAEWALDYNGQYMPYSQYDCIGFVNLVWHDIPDVPAGVTLGNDGQHYGTNTLWRSTQKFYTTDPNGNYPTNELWWKGTISDCESIYGDIPAGALLFHQIPEDGNPPIPAYYRGDGIGNFVHVGIYCGNGKVMQSGGLDAGSVPGGGVHLSDYNPSAWSHVAFLVYVNTRTEPPEPPEPPDPPWSHYQQELFLCYTNVTRQRRLLKNVIRKF